MTAFAVPAVEAGIEDHVGEADHVLVLGAAEDAFAAARAAGLTGRVIGVGLDEPALAAAEGERRRAGWHSLEFRRETGGSLPAADGSVDAVVIGRPAALSQPRGALLCEIARVLRTGGRLVVPHPSPG